MESESDSLTNSKEMKHVSQSKQASFFRNLRPKISFSFSIISHAPDHHPTHPQQPLPALWTIADLLFNEVLKLCLNWSLRLVEQDLEDKI